MCAKLPQLYPTLCNPINCGHQVPLSMGFFMGILEWIAMPSSRGSSLLRDGSCVSYISCIGRRVLYHQHHPGSPEFTVQFSSVQSLSHVRLFATSWTAAHQASLSITNSRSLLKLTSIESVMTSNHLILCHPLLLLPSTLPSIRVFSNESVLHIRWPKYWSFSFNISPSNEHPGLISFRTGWIPLQSKGFSRVFSNTTVQKHQFFSTQLSLWSNSHIHT